MVFFEVVVVVGDSQSEAVGLRSIEEVDINLGKTTIGEGSMCVEFSLSRYNYKSVCWDRS